MATASLIAPLLMLRKCHLKPARRHRHQDRSCASASPARGAGGGVLHAGRRGGAPPLARLGFRRARTARGADRLRPRVAGDTGSGALDLSPLLVVGDGPRSCPGDGQRIALDQHIGHELLRQAQDAIDGGPQVEIELPVRNTDRAAGAMLSGEVARQHGSRGLPDDTIRVRLTGSAGQSFGAFLAAGVTLELEGDANDYAGKGLSGGRLIVRPPREAPFAPEESVIVGNTCLYGATAARRSSRVKAASGSRCATARARGLEGVGDHGAST